MDEPGISFAILLIGGFGLMAGVLAVAWRRPVRGLYLAFFACGILITPELPVVREKLTATELILLMTGLAMMFHARAWRNRALPLLRSQQTPINLGGFFILWIGLSFGVNNLQFQDGLISSLVETLNFLYGFLVFCTVLLLVDDWEKWFGCLTSWFLGAAVVSGVGVWAMTGTAPAWALDEVTNRLSSTLRASNQVPAFLLPIFATVAIAAARRGARAIRRGVLTALLAGMALTAIGTGSRTALLMLGLSSAGVWFLATRRSARRALNMGLLMGLALGLVVGLVAYFTIALTSYEGDYSLVRTPAWQRPAILLTEWGRGERALDPTRPAQLNLVWENFSDYPMFGTGPKLAGLRIGTEEIHNTYANLLLEVGIPGVALFLLWLFSVLWIGWNSGHRCRDPYRQTMVMSLLVGFIALMLYSATMFGLRQRNIWLLAGLLVAVPRLLRGEQRAPPRSWRANSAPPGGV